MTVLDNLNLDPSLLKLDRYPRSAKYDPQWSADNSIGAYSLWLVEGLTQVMDLRPGMRVMDLGCGRAAGAIFMAREFGVQVWAVDPMVKATDNWQRAVAAGVGDLVFPVQAGDIPPHLKQNWHPDFDAYHSCDWWRRHWEKTGLVEFEMIDEFPADDGWQIWLRFEQMQRKVGIVGLDQGRNITFIRWVARKKA